MIHEIAWGRYFDLDSGITADRQTWPPGFADSSDAIIAGALETCGGVVVSDKVTCEPHLGRGKLFLCRQVLVDDRVAAREAAA